MFILTPKIHQIISSYTVCKYILYFQYCLYLRVSFSSFSSFSTFISFKGAFYNRVQLDILHQLRRKIAYFCLSNLFLFVLIGRFHHICPLFLQFPFSVEKPGFSAFFAQHILLVVCTVDSFIFLSYSS